MFMSPEETLLPLGFTETEALAYCELQRAGPSTGYRIAQGIGKAQANTYKTLSTLAQKGAVIDDGGDPRSFRAVAPDRLIAALTTRFTDQTETAVGALLPVAGGGLEGGVDDEGGRRVHAVSLRER